MIQLGSGFGLVSVKVTEDVATSLRFHGSANVLRRNEGKSYHGQDIDIESSNSLVIGIFEVEKKRTMFGSRQIEKKIFAVLKGDTYLSESLKEYIRNMSNHPDDIRTQELVLDYLLKSQMAAGPVEQTLASQGLFVAVDVMRHQIQSVTVSAKEEELSMLVRAFMDDFENPNFFPKLPLVYRSGFLLRFVTVFQPGTVEEGARSISALDDFLRIRIQILESSLNEKSDDDLIVTLVEIRAERDQTKIPLTIHR